MSECVYKYMYVVCVLSGVLKLKIMTAMQEKEERKNVKRNTEKKTRTG